MVLGVGCVSFEIQSQSHTTLSGPSLPSLFIVVLHRNPIILLRLTLHSTATELYGKWKTFIVLHPSSLQYKITQMKEVPFRNIVNIVLELMYCRIICSVTRRDRMMERSARKLSIFPDGSLQVTAVDNAGSTAATNLMIKYRTERTDSQRLCQKSRHVSIIHNTENINWEGGQKVF